MLLTETSLKIVKYPVRNAHKLLQLNLLQGCYIAVISGYQDPNGFALIAPT